MEPFCNFSINPQIDFNSFVNKDFGFQKEGFFKEFFKLDLDDFIYKNPHGFLNLMYNFFILSEESKNFISHEFYLKTINMWKGYMFLKQGDDLFSNVFPFKYAVQYMIDYLSQISYKNRDLLEVSIKKYSIEEIKSFINGIDYQSENLSLGKIKFFQTKNDINFVKETTSLSFDNWFVVSNDDKFKIFKMLFNNNELIKDLIINIEENLRLYNFLKEETPDFLSLEMKRLYDDFLYNLVKINSLNIFNDLIKEQIEKINIFTMSLNDKFKDQILINLKVKNKFIEFKSST